MVMRVRDAGVLRTIKSLTVRQAGISRRILTMKVMNGDVLRTVAVFVPPLTITVNQYLTEQTIGSPPSVATRYTAQASAFFPGARGRSRTRGP